MGTSEAGGGLNRDIRINFGDGLHNDGLGGDTQATQHKNCELMGVRDGNTEPVEQFLIGGRWWLEEQDAWHVACRKEVCGRGSSGNLVIEDRHQICRSWWSLLDEQSAKLGKYRLVPYPEGCRPEEQ